MSSPARETELSPALKGLLGDLHEDPGNLDAYALLFLHLRREVSSGRNHLGSGSLPYVIVFFDARLAEEPHDPNLLYGRGVAAKMSHDYSSAVRHLEAGIRAGARFWGIFDELIPYYRTKKELLGGIAILEDRLIVDPENAFLQQGLGYLHFYLDDYGPARIHFDRAFDLLKAQDDVPAQTACLYYLAYFNMYLNQYDQAERDIKQSLHFARRLGDARAEILGLDLLGFLRIEQGNFKDALELAFLVFEKSHASNDPELMARSWRTLGVAYLETGDLAHSEDSLNKAAAWYSLAGESRYLEIVFYWQAVLYKQLGDFSRALELASRVLATTIRTGWLTSQAFNLSLIGEIYYSLGHYEKSLNFNNKALLITRNHIGKWSRGECLNSIGAVYVEMARYREALENFELALDYFLKIGHNRQVARCLYNIGMAHLNLGDPESAMKYFHRSRVEAEQSGNRKMLGLVLIRLGDYAVRRDDLKEAETLYLAAQKIGVETGHPEIGWQAYAGRGDLAARRGHVQDAADSYRRSIAVIEEQRNTIIERQHSAGFLQGNLEVYEKLINLYFDLHRVDPRGGFDEHCFHSVEKAKSRAFLDDLNASRIDPHAFPASPESRRKIDLLSKEVSRLMIALSGSGHTRQRREELWKSLEQAEEDLQIAVEATQRIRPDLALLFRSEPSLLPAIRKNVLKPDTALIEYFMGERNLLIFYLTRNRLAVHRLDENETRTARNLVRNYSRLLSSSGISSSDCAAAGRRLYEILIAPGREILEEGIRHLIVVPDRELYLLPFESLCAGSDSSGGGASPEYLVYGKSITYAPSASALVNIVTRTKSGHRAMDLLAVGDPLYMDGTSGQGRAEWDTLPQEYYREKRFAFETLPYSRHEIETVAGFVPRKRRTVLLGQDASEEAVKRLPLSEYKILHFALHSLMDEHVASRSALALTQDVDSREDGFLQVHEIYRTRLNADLVVLSACRTAMGKLERGEGLQGLPPAFLSAGADSVIVSLWPAKDRSTARFMKRFYDHLAQGRPKKEALRLAKIDVIQTGDARPSDWAGFILVGEGTRPVSMGKPSPWDRMVSGWKRLISRMF